MSEPLKSTHVVTSTQDATTETVSNHAAALTIQSQHSGRTSSNQSHHVGSSAASNQTQRIVVIETCRPTGDGPAAVTEKYDTLLLNFIDRILLIHYFSFSLYFQLSYTTEAFVSSSWAPGDQSKDCGFKSL